MNVSSKGIDGMAFLNQHGQLGDLWFARASYRWGRKPTHESIFIFIVIVFFHLALIVIALNSKITQLETSVVPALKMVLLSPVKIPIKTELDIPLIESVSIKTEVVLPAIFFEKEAQPALDITFEQSSKYYEFPNKKAERYKDVFDPKLRKTLEDLPIKTMPKPKIQYLGVGITLEDIGNGKCIYGNAFAGEGRIVKCGPDEGERMMLNVERALVDPLGLK